MTTPLDAAFARLAAVTAADDQWTEEDERKHPRGNPGNPGQFRKKDGPAAPTAPKQDLPPGRPSVPKAERPTAPKKPPQSLPKPPRGATVKDLAKTQPDHPLLKAMAERGDLHPRDGGAFLPAGKYPEGDPRNDPEFEAYHDAKEYLSARYAGVTREAIEKAKAKGKSAEVIAAMEKAYKQRKKDRADNIGGETQEIFDRRPDPQTGARNTYTPARATLHEDILEKMEAAAADVPKGGDCIVLGGPSGAGKSTFLRQHGAALGVEFKPDPKNPKKKVPANYIVINPDDFKEVLQEEMTAEDLERYPGLDANELANLLHEESSDLAKRAVRRLMSQGYNVILDITLSDAEKAKKHYVNDYDETYSYRSVLIDGDVRNSLHNAGNRWKKPDEVTGERAFSGRFIPMSLVLDQDASPEQKEQGYRSKNAAAFDEFSEDPRVDEAMVYDPYAADPSAALRTVKERAQQARAASLSAIKRRLWGMLRAEGRVDDVKTTEITDKIQAFKSGEISEQALFRYLTEDARYAKPEHKVAPGEEGRYRYVEGGAPYTPGTFEEVTRARDAGLLSRSFYERVNAVLHARGVPEDD